MNITKNLQFFLIALVLMSCFSWGTNSLGQNLEEFFYWQQFSSNEKILTAQANQMEFAERVRDAKPFRDKSVGDINVGARAAISIFLNIQGGEKILFEKNSAEKFPIASLTKLMTANVIFKNYDLSREITVSREAVSQEENFGQLQVGAILTVEDLLYPLLIESSNDAGFALANDYDGINEESFVVMMNSEVQNLGLNNTYFYNTTGLDPDEGKPQERINKSSARDIATLAENLMDFPLIWEILSTETINIYGPELKNTNKLLGKIPGIVGGKTGYTDEALGCFMLVLEAPKNKGYMVNVILGTAEDRFQEMEKLINWLYQAYEW